MLNTWDDPFAKFADNKKQTADAVHKATTETHESIETHAAPVIETTAAETPVTETAVADASVSATSTAAASTVSSTAPHAGDGSIPLGACVNASS